MSGYASDEMRHDDIVAENRRGEWVPAIPEPLFVWRGVHCGGHMPSCRRFRSLRRYREHYALVHILALDD